MSRKFIRTEQIGPSGHKNEYHIGVLHGNWQEECEALGRKATVDTKFGGVSEAHSSFVRRDLSEHQKFVFVKKNETCPRELLFGQSAAASLKPEDLWVTNSQLSWGCSQSATAKAKNYVGRLDLKGAAAGSSSVAPTIPASQLLGGSAHLHTVSGDKARHRQQELDDDEPFRTTKQQTLDITAERIQRGEVPRSPRDVRARGGQITNELHTAAHKIHLRQ